MKNKSILAASFFAVSLTLISCGEKPQNIEMGKEFKVYENPITVLKVEESKILRNDKDSTLLIAPNGKKYVYAEVKNPKNEMIFIKAFSKDSEVKYDDDLSLSDYKHDIDKGFTDDYFLVDDNSSIDKLVITDPSETQFVLTNPKITKSTIKIVTGYTRESGVRGLDKKIAEVVRFAAKSVAMEEEYNVKLKDENLITILKAPRMEQDKYENNEVAGVVTGLAWTSVGGDILFIESLLSKGKGAMTMTGNLGNVMKESVTIALEFIKANAKSLGINEEILNKYNIHIHVPEGATPKDGPSAGIAMLTSMVSSFTQKRVKKSIAMTGEITLRGKVLPVGGIKEKILAAKRANIKEIILCKENKRDIDEIKADYLHGLTFHFVENMLDVIKIAITDSLVKNPIQLELKN